MYGYIVLNDDMSGLDNDIIFETGKWYAIEGEIFSVRNGFLFFKKPEDIVKFERIKENRFFKIETDGEVFQEGECFVAKKIRLLEEIPANEKMVKMSNFVAKTIGIMGVIIFLIMIPFWFNVIKLDATAIWGFVFFSIVIGLGILKCFLYCAINYTSKKQYQKYLDSFQK